MRNDEARIHSEERSEIPGVEVKVWLPEVDASHKAFENIGLQKLEQTVSHQVTGAWFPDSFARAV